MRTHPLFAAVLAAVMGIACCPASPVSAAALVDSGMDYSESTETLQTPGAGYTTTLWYVCKPGETKIQNPAGNLVLLFVDIGAFSAGANGTTDDAGNYTEGTDYNLDAAFFAGMRGTLENCRKNGSTVALRFRYDANGKTNPEPGTFEQVLHHIDQIKADGFLEDYKDILMYVESGFVGAWGEQHSGKYTSLAYKARLLEAVLAMTPEDIPVTVRTPDIFRAWKGLDMDGMAAWESAPGSPEARVGLYNDGYMGSDSDLGTYSNRAVETAWLGRQAVSTYYGGEFSGNLAWAQQYDTYLPEHAIPEMYETHLSYINSNIYALYDDYPYQAAYDPDGVDNSAYYGQSVRKFIRDHLGYRFTVRDCDLSGTCEQGGTFDMTFSVENTGFANPIRPQKAELLLEQDGTYIVTPIALDSRTWRSCTVQHESLRVQIPGSLPAGEWNLYLRLSVGEQGIADAAKRTVQFANPGIWNASLGANRMGSITVTETRNALQQAQQTFAVNGADAGNAVYYSLRGCVTHDGMRSDETEWTDSNLLASQGEGKLWAANDDTFLYIAAELPQAGTKPVVNLRVHPADTEISYWFYRQSAGWIYYNQGDHSGISLRTQGDFIEFRIELSAMALHPGSVLDQVRVFVQDEGNDWSLVGDIAGEGYTLTPGITFCNAFSEVSLCEGSCYTLHAPTAAEGVEMTWLHDGKKVGAGESYTIQAASQADAGLYSVTAVSPAGTQVTQEICRITQVIEASPLRGDLNADGKVNAGDIRLLQDYLHGKPAAITGDADLNGDGVWDVFDLALLKRI